MKFYLEQLLCALNDEEILTLRNMPLRKSKIKSYIEILIDNRKTGIPQKELIQVQLNLDSNTFKKIKSETLSKCLKELVPAGGPELLHFLSVHRLPEIYRREADDIIKGIENNKKTKPEEKAKIYYQTIRGYFRLPYGDFDPAKLEKYLNGFLLNYTGPDKEITKELIKLNVTYILLVKSFFTMDVSEKNYKEFQREISASMKEAEKLKNKRLQHFAEAVQLVLDFYYKECWNELEAKFNKVCQSYKLLNDPQTHDELLAIRFYIGYNQVMLNNYEKANELFRELENDYKPVVYHYSHIIYRYALSLLIAGQNKECQLLIDKCLKKNILAYDTDGTALSCVVFAAYHLLENELDKALAYINLFRETIDRKELLALEIVMRLLEIIYYYQRGDDKFAASQLKRFIRFMNDKSDRQGIKNLLGLSRNLSILFEKFIAERITIREFEAELINLFPRKTNIGGVLFINAAKVRSHSTPRISPAK